MKSELGNKDGIGASLLNGFDEASKNLLKVETTASKRMKSMLEQGKSSFA